MKPKLDKWKIFFSILLAIIPIGGAAATYGLKLQIASIKSETKEETLATVRNTYATKEETSFIKDGLQELRDTAKEMKAGIDVINERTYDIQKNLFLVRTTNDRAVKIQRNLAATNEKIEDLQTTVQRAVISKEEKKKKK